MADCKVNVFGVTVEYEQGATYAEIAKDYKEKVDGDPVSSRSFFMASASQGSLSLRLMMIL